MSEKRCVRFEANFKTVVTKYLKIAKKKNTIFNPYNI